MKELAEHIVVCNGARINCDSEKKLVLEHHDGCDNKNVFLNLHKFTNSVYHLDNRTKDLLEIAGYIFAADRKTYRGTSRDVIYDGWERLFHFHICVRDLAFWNREDVKQNLKEALVFVTGDNDYKFTFYEGAEDFPENIFDQDSFKIDKPDDLKIMLFSGGLDSLAGAIELLETTNSEICLVSHQSGQPSVIKTQKTIYDAINNDYPGRCKHYKYRCGLKECKSIDETQRSRSFLYTATAFAIAKTYGQDCIYVYENGVTSINFAETQDLINARASRTTHPKTLKLLEKLFEKIADKPFEIKHPYLFKTKTDVVEVIKKYNRQNYLDSSVSCSATRNHQSSFTHCGTCSQCIDRRFAVYSAEVENFDENGIYDFNFLTQDLEEDEIKKSLTDYIRMANDFGKQNIDNFYYKRSDEIIEIEEYIDGKDEQERIEKLFNLFQQHSKQIDTAIRRMRKEHDPPFNKPRPNSFFSLIIDRREYLKEETKLEKKQEAKIENDLKRENELLNNQLGNAQLALKRYNKVKFAKIDYSSYPYTKVSEIADETRKNNKKLNFKKIAEQLGVSDKTAHNICNYHNIT